MVSSDSGSVSSTSNMLWMRGVGGICVWLGASWVEGGGEWMRSLGLGFTSPVGTGGVLKVCLGCCGGEWVGDLDYGMGVVFVSCESGLSVYIAGPGICILCLVDTCAS